jgi:hypothetical protein
MGVGNTNGFNSMNALAKERNIVLRGADALSQNGFTQVPNSMLKSCKLSPGAKLAYAMLLSYAWQNEYCFPGQETLAKDMGSGLRSVVRYIKEFEDAKFLKIKKLGQGRVNLYELNLTVPKGGRSKERKGGRS